jgi:hypothetical protein
MPQNNKARTLDDLLGFIWERVDIAIYILNLHLWVIVDIGSNHHPKIGFILVEKYGDYRL